MPDSVPDTAKCDWCCTQISEWEPEVEVFINCDPNKRACKLQEMTLCCGCFDDLGDHIVEVRNSCS